MKQTLLTAFYALTIVAAGFAPVVAQPGPGGAAPAVITEIMYNPPETGNDSLEFVEIYNPNVSAVINMGGYYIDDAFAFTFPSGFVLGVGEHVIITGDSVIFENTFGVEAFEWSGSTTQLNNSGEVITLKNASGQVVDMVSYLPATGWPTAANGQGYSLVLCDPTADNSIAANWTASENNTGVVVNGMTIYADPGASSTCTSTSISDDDNVITTVVYPNPTEGAFRMSFSALERSGSVYVHNSLGQMVYTQALASGATSVNVDANLQAGIYIVTLETGETTERHYLSVTK